MTSFYNPDNRRKVVLGTSNKQVDLHIEYVDGGIDGSTGLPQGRVTMSVNLNGRTIFEMDNYSRPESFDGMQRLLTALKMENLQAPSDANANQARVEYALEKVESDRRNAEYKVKYDREQAILKAAQAAEAVTV